MAEKNKEKETKKKSKMKATGRNISFKQTPMLATCGVQEKEREALIELARMFRYGPQVADRKHKMKTYKDVFIGAFAVTAYM